MYLYIYIVLQDRLSLFSASEAGEELTVMSLLNSGVDPNFTVSYACTYMVMMLSRPIEEMLQINLQDGNSLTIVHIVT